jgi:hypothetical protein
MRFYLPLFLFGGVRSPRVLRRLLMGLEEASLDHLAQAGRIRKIRVHRCVINISWGVSLFLFFFYYNHLFGCYRGRSVGWEGKRKDVK